MSRTEARRRLQQADPNLKIVSGRKRPLTTVPRVLSPEEVKQWGLPQMIPIFPPEEILEIEAHWFKKDLQRLAREYFLDPHGPKDILIEKLIYVGAMDDEGRPTGKSVKELRERALPSTVPAKPFQSDYLQSKRYLVNQMYRLVLPIGFDSAYGANEYRKKHNLTKFNLILRGREVKGYFNRGYREVPAEDIPKPWDGPKPVNTVPYTVPVVGPKFDMGAVVVTAGVNDQIGEDEDFAKFVMSSLRRHAYGDWGEMDPADKKANDEAINKRLRIFSAYEKHPLPKIWIITEADRSATTILFPEEY